MFSTNSATGPWQTAWTFTVPENVAEKGSTIFYKAKEDMKENAESAPWWRLVILDNYGSQACVAIAAPLKLLVSARGEHMRMKQIKRNTITFLEDSFFAQKHLMSWQRSTTLSQLSYRKRTSTSTRRRTGRQVFGPRRISVTGCLSSFH